MQLSELYLHGRDLHTHRNGRVFNYALQHHPELDIALVNMANTLKDMVRILLFTQAVYPKGLWFRRAVLQMQFLIT